MRVGGYRRITLISALFFCFLSAEVVAHPLLGLMTRVVAPRLLTASRTGVVIEGEIVKKSVGELAVMTSRSFRQIRLPMIMNGIGRVGQAANWLGVGYAVKGLSDEFFKSPMIYTMSAKTGTKVYGSSPESMLMTVFEIEKAAGNLSGSRCVLEKCNYGALYDIEVKGNSATGKYPAMSTESDFKSTFTFTRTFSSDQPIILKNGSMMVKSGADEKQVLDALADRPVSNADLTRLLNALMMQMTSQQGYQGVPFDSASMFTENEVKEAMKGHESVKWKDMLQPATNEQGGIDVDFQAGISPEPKPEPEPGKTGTDIDMTHPDNSPPDLNSPTAEQIISPLNGVFPFLKDFDIDERPAQCPVGEFDVFDRHYVIDTHCALFEKIRGLMTLFSLIIWSFLGLRIVLSS